LLLMLAVAGCRPESRVATGPSASYIQTVQMVKIPNIAGDGEGGFVITFFDGDELRFSRVRDSRWSTPRTIAKGNLLVNSADFPAIAVNGRTLHASWSTRNEQGAMIHLATSQDDGMTWVPSATPHPALASQFGFVSLLPSGDAVFLDGRKLEGGMEGAGEMELRVVQPAPGTQHGAHSTSFSLDSRVCDCCQTAAAMTDEGPIFAYRDRSADEVRDIAYVRRTASGWSEPQRLHADNWKIDGCPVNGPQLDARGREVVAVWFTAANEQPRVYAAFSEDAGATFGAPIRVDVAKTSGRADVVLRDDGAAIVTFIDGGVLHARRVSRDGKTGEPLRIGEASGFPRIALSKENVGVVWGAGDGVHFATLENL
jgi:hypothetical protein